MTASQMKSAGDSMKPTQNQVAFVFFSLGTIIQLEPFRVVMAFAIVLAVHIPLRKEVLKIHCEPVRDCALLNIYFQKNAVLFQETLQGENAAALAVAAGRGLLASDKKGIVVRKNV